MTLQGLEAVCELWQYAGLTTEFSIKYPNFFSYSLSFNQVIVFSFMGDFRGRVIHAYFDGTDIIVKKTNFYHFYPVEKPRKDVRTILAADGKYAYWRHQSTTSKHFAPKHTALNHFGRITPQFRLMSFAVIHTSIIEDSIYPKRGVSYLCLVSSIHVEVRDHSF